MNQSPLPQEKNHKTNILALGIVALVALGIVTFATQYVSEANKEIARVSSGTVAGVQAARQEATLVITGTPTPRRMTFDLTGSVSALDLIIRSGLREGFAVETQKFDFGTIVNAIDGVRGGDGGKYWLYYINGQQATVGADAYTVKAGDEIDFRFE